MQENIFHVTVRTNKRRHYRANIIHPQIKKNNLQERQITQKCAFQIFSIALRLELLAKNNKQGKKRPSILRNNCLLGIGFYFR